MSTSPDNKYNRPLNADEMKRFMKTARLLMLSAFVFMTTLTLLVHFEAIRLYPSSMNAEMVSGFVGRVEFALRYQTLLVVWLLYNIFATIGVRFTHKALNPLEEKSEQNVQLVKNVLANSYEQILLSVLAQLIYVSFASPECVLKVIPLVNIIQFVGRITFFAGYPLKRSFGFMCTMIPTIVLIAYNVYKFVAFLGSF